MTREIVSTLWPEMRAKVAPGCDVCAALAKEWDERRDRDVLMEINNHPHGTPKLSRVAEWIGAGGVEIQ
ncbi:hypothetical protein [Streptomyces sp. H39-S7]|uniref:hypothetical protein n=1 Tax=Streptomyces sp. H39-S7 TaxID=3004357 RepID=UPI0022AF808C|nr:hypothetical protein [Streptomyces sp. H39-S7]MCZ4117833.1 hypothetical protein [Streptomyces sp. H39-S7]